MHISNLKLYCSLLILSLSLFMGCIRSNSNSTPTDPNDPLENVECFIDEDCLDQPMISIWYPTCSGDTLQTPVGSGTYSCQQNVCVIDFMVEETDCALTGQVCDVNPAENVQGDACVDVYEEMDITPESQCLLLNELSLDVGCAPWPVNDCIAESSGPQNDALCAIEFYDLLLCALENTDGCYCEDDGDLNCDPTFNNDEGVYPNGAPCQLENDDLNQCRGQVQNPELDLYTPESQCELMNELSELVGCATWPVNDCIAEEGGPQSDAECAEEFYDILQCSIENSDGCYCEEDGDLNCDPALRNDGEWYEGEAPCQLENDIFAECRLTSE